MKKLLKGLWELFIQLLTFLVLLPIAQPICEYLLTLEPVAKFYNLILYYMDGLIGFIARLIG